MAPMSRPTRRVLRRPATGFLHTMASQQRKLAVSTLFVFSRLFFKKDSLDFLNSLGPRGPTQGGPECDAIFL